MTRLPTGVTPPRRSSLVGRVAFAAPVIGAGIREKSVTSVPNPSVLEGSQLQVDDSVSPSPVAVTISHQQALSASWPEVLRVLVPAGARSLSGDRLKVIIGIADGYTGYTGYTGSRLGLPTNQPTNQPELPGQRGYTGSRLGLPTNQPTNQPELLGKRGSPKRGIDQLHP